jgi:hypothetical protein
LILNIIAPDNYQKKFLELRGYLFQEHKMKDECKTEGIDYDEETHKLKSENIRDDILTAVVDNLFRKA